MHLNFLVLTVFCFFGCSYSFPSTSNERHEEHHGGHQGGYRPENHSACTLANGATGRCTPKLSCTSAGEPNRFCRREEVCCPKSTSAACGAAVSRNNTNWKSPAVVSASSTCAMTIKTKGEEPEICQIRLDFISFTTAQPVAGNCVDTFQVTGSTSVTPTICGDNTGQHMYLDVSSNSDDIKLLFNFGADASIKRLWNIKVTMIPCGASYLAPPDCLQYFTGATGQVKSFNWQDVAGTATRQLNNQNYNICFRTELVSSQKATELCLSVCAVTNGGDAFSITTPTSIGVGNAAAAVAAAKTDLANAQTALTNAQATLTTAQTTLTESQTALASAKTAFTTATDAFNAAKDALATAQAAVPVAQTALDAALGVLIDAQVVLDNAKGTLTTGLAVLEAAQTNLAAVQAAVVDPSNPTAAETAAIDAAQTAVSKAQSAVIDAQTAVENAQMAFDVAQTAVTNAQAAVLNAENVVIDAETTLDNAKTDMLNAQLAVNDAQTVVDNAKIDVDNKQTAVTVAQTAVTTAQAALIAAQTAFANAVATAGTLSGVGTSAIVNGVNTATCLYDFLLIAGARDSTNVEADRFCGNALNPAINPVATSVPVCTSIKQLKMTYRTDGTEDAVAAGVNILPALADSGNVGFCLEYQEK